MMETMIVFMNFKTRIVMASVAVAMVAVVACGSEDEKPAAAPTPGAIVTPTPASGIPGVTQTGDRGAINSADELSDLFQNTDVTSSRGEEITPAFIGLDGELMTLFGERIEVYVFDSLEDAEAFASGISANGTSIVGPDGSISSVLWIAPPHWYIRGDTILLYVGENLDVIDLLDSIAARRGGGERQVGIVVPPFKMRGTPVPVGGAPTPTPAPPGEFTLALKVIPDGPNFLFVAELMGGPDNEESLYCQGWTLAPGDGNGIAAMPSCVMYTPDVEIQRHFEVSYAYEEPGVYEAVFEYGHLVSNSVRVVAESVDPRATATVPDVDLPQIVVPVATLVPDATPTG